MDMSMGVLASVCIGLIMVGAIIGVGALVLQNVDNITTDQYVSATYSSCLQSNASNGTCSLVTGYVIPEYSGNWTMGNANSLTGNYSDGNLGTFPQCGNTTSTDIQCNATWMFRNSNTSLSGASSMVVTIYNYTGTGTLQNYTVSLPDACTWNSGSPLYFTTIRAVKNTSTSALTYYCNSTAGWQTIATYRNASATVATGWYPLGSEPWVNWSVRGADVINGPGQSVLTPIQNSQSSLVGASSWLSTVAIVAVASVVIGLVAIIYGVLGAGRGGGNSNV